MVLFDLIGLGSFGLATNLLLEHEPLVFTLLKEHNLIGAELLVQVVDLAFLGVQFLEEVALDLLVLGDDRQCRGFSVVIKVGKFRCR